MLHATATLTGDTSLPLHGLHSSQVFLPTPPPPQLVQALPSRSESQKISACSCKACVSEVPEDFFPRGRLRSRLAFWREIGASEFVQRVICDGYFLPFVRIPVACSLANQPSAFAHYPFVSNTLSSLLSRGVVEECGQRDLHVVSPLGVVPTAQDKLRLILDLRYLNDHLASSKFFWEDLRCVAVLFEPGFELSLLISKTVTITLRLLQHIVSFKVFLGPLEGNWRFFCFTGLPFWAENSTHYFY